MLKMWISVLLLGITLWPSSAIVNFQYPSTNPCIIFDASLQISIVGVFKPDPQVRQISLDNKAVLLNSTASYCDNGNSSSLDFFMEGGVGFTVTFLKMNDTVKMMPSISFIPAVIFNSFSNDTNQVALKGTKGKLLPPTNVSYSCFTGDTPIVMTNGSSAGVSYHAIISITELQVQAFDIENGKLSPGESCDAIPIPSVAPIVTPKPGNPPVKTYSINNGNADCIVLQAGIEFSIPYTSNGARLMKTVGVPDATQVTGVCGEGVATMQSLSLMFYDDWLLNFILAHSSSTSNHLLMDGITYGIKEISLEYNISSTLFPDADNTGEKVLAKHVYATPEFLTPVGSSYRCQASTTVDVQGIQTRLTSFQYLAFGSQNTTSFDPNAVTDCPSPAPSHEDNDHTGTIVGVVIAVFFIVMVFIGIIIYMKRKGKGSYEQVY